MASITIQRKVILRSIVTDQLKQELDQELQNAMDEIDQRIQQIDFRAQPYITGLQRSNIQQAMAVRKQVEAEKEKHQQLRSTLEQRRQQVQALNTGDEIVRGTLDSQVEIDEGDNLAEAIAGVEIVTKDDIVVEIRQRQVTDIAEEEVPKIITDLSGGIDLDASPQR